MTAFQDMGRHAAYAMNAGNKADYLKERDACHRAIQRLPDSDKLTARQEFDHAYRQWRKK